MISILNIKTIEDNININKPPKKKNNQNMITSVQSEAKKPNNKYCSICNKVFSTPINLRNHIKTIHDKNFPFKCTYPNCNKQYSIATRLKVHMRTHLGEKPYQCDICFKSFVEKGNLKTHKKFHSSLRPFKCPQCDKSYKTNGHLKDHIEIQHNKIKKFKCPICNNSFGRSSTLKSHIRTHTGEKTIKCKVEGCNKFFAEKGNMLIHYRRHAQRIEEAMKEKSQSTEIENAMTRPCSNATLVEAAQISNSNNYIFINIGNNNNCNVEEDFHNFSPLDLNDINEANNCGEDELEKQFNFNLI